MGSPDSVDVRRHHDHAASCRARRLCVLDKQYLDLTTVVGQGFLAFLSSLAQDERERITKRAAEGRKAAVARGVHMGRKPKLTEHQVRGCPQAHGGRRKCPSHRQGDGRRAHHRGSGGVLRKKRPRR
jgi:hypothetical protein